MQLIFVKQEHLPKKTSILLKTMRKYPEPITRLNTITRRLEIPRKPWKIKVVSNKSFSSGNSP